MVLKISVVSVSMPAVTETIRYAEGHLDQGLEFRIHYVGDGTDDISDIMEDVSSADVALTDLMGVDSSAFSSIVSALKRCKGQRLAIGGMAPQLSRLGGYDAERFRMNEDDEENLHRISESWKRAEPRDIEFVFGLVLSRYLGADIPCPEYSEIREGVFLKDPLTLVEYDSYEEYAQKHGFGDKIGTILMTFSGNSYPTSNLEGTRMLFSKLESFADVIPVAMSSYNIRFVDQMRTICGNPDVIVNVLPFRFMAGPMGGDSVSAVGLLKDLDATLLSPFFLTKSTREEWESSDQGVNAMEFMLNIFLPELDGALCTIPIGFTEETERTDGFGISLSEIRPLEERVDRLAGKVRRYLELRHRPIPERRVALISYNYPPGEGNLFGGSFLDGAGSIANITSALHDAGYSVDPMTSDQVVDEFLGRGILNDGEWIEPSEGIVTFKGTRKHPDAVTERWGPAPGRVMTRHGGYIIPGLINGNLFIGLQPPRGGDPVETAESYHDVSIPPHHQYLAMYEWIRDEFRADAVIHLGTHGTLEFLPGKDCAPSGDCYPDMVMDDMVHIYAYYAGNPSEAIIAKRRTHACLVSYMPPAFTRSGLYGEMVELEDLIAEYRESSRTDPGRAQAVLGSIVSKARELRLPEDVEELEDELVSIRESLIPVGLHAFGSALSEDEAVTYAVNAMAFPHDSVPPMSEGFPRIGAEEAESILRRFIDDGTVPDGIPETGKACLEYGRELASRASSSKEIEGLVRALDSRFIEAKPGGDSMKDPDVLPSGFNILQFNPNNIPSMAAFERGAKSAEDVISQYREATGSFPRRAALVLWGLETSRTQGMTVGQICGYLGIRMVRPSGEFHDRFQVIPLEELGRPRVDVTVSMCGFFRDMFPNLVSGLDSLFRMVATLDEPPDMNPVPANNARNRGMLSALGYSGDELDDLAGCRLFGPRDGEYGTSVTDAVGNSTWDDEDELGTNFERCLRYAYTSKARGLDAGDLLGFNHSDVDVVSQVRDSSDRELIDLDHYYEFLGGLSKAVEIARGGNKASVYVVDGSGPTVRTTGVRRSIERGLRTRLLNRKWIDGLLSVRYHGAQKINDRFENVLGLAATVGEVDTGVFDDMFRCYVEDEEMRRRVQENNNWAYMSMLDRLSEADDRGYWDATDEERERLREAYEESEEIAELESDRTDREEGDPPLSKRFRRDRPPRPPPNRRSGRRGRGRPPLCRLRRRRRP